ncbi:MAG: ABC transporter ATP-binding protein [Deinococcales bacterium]
MSLLEISDLEVAYGQIQALKGISLEVAEGEVVAMLGANGAGKTTLMRTLSGLIPPKAGRITLTVAENLRLGAYTRPPDEVEGTRTQVYELFPRLYARRAQLAGTLSGGEQQMLAIGRALMARPRLLLLDEPSLGLAPLLVKGIFRALQDIRETGVTILLVEQNARMALRLADRGYVLEVGSIVHEDGAAELLASPEVQAAYLGKA